MTRLEIEGLETLRQDFITTLIVRACNVIWVTFNNMSLKWSPLSNTPDSTRPLITRDWNGSELKRVRKRRDLRENDACQIPVVDKVHRSSTWVKVQIRIIKYYSSKSTAFSILLEWKYKSTQFFMYLSKKVLIDRFILQFYIDYFI